MILARRMFMYVTSCLVEIPLNLIWCKQSIICPWFSGTLNIVFFISVHDIFGNHVVFSPLSSVCDYRFSHHELFNQLERLTCYFFQLVIVLVHDSRYRKEDSLELNDIEASNKYNIDTTGLVCKFCSSKFIFVVEIHMIPSVCISSCVWSCSWHLSVAVCQYLPGLFVPFAMIIGRHLCGK